MSKQHDLKVWDEFYNAVEDGSKPFEARKNDRDYQVGDILKMRSFNPHILDYSGRSHKRMVTFILHGPGFGVEEGYCIMGLSRDKV